MTRNDLEDIGEILRGYEHWRRNRIHAIENGPDDQLSVSAYLDDYAKTRALDILAQIQAVYSNPELTWQEIDAEIRNLIGAKV